MVRFRKSFRPRQHVRPPTLVMPYCVLSRPLSIYFRPMGPPPRPPPIITINQFRPAMFQVPHGAPEELHRLTQDIAPDLIGQPPLPIYRGTIATKDRSNSRCQCRSFMKRITISASASFVRSVGSERKCLNAPPSLLSGTARNGNHEQSIREGVTSVASHFVSFSDANRSGPRAFPEHTRPYCFKQRRCRHPKQ
jgi:hypothetical protein